MAVHTLLHDFEVGNIPYYYSRYFNGSCTCSICGTPLKSRNKGATVFCDNDNCPTKIAARVEEILTTLTIKGYTRDGLTEYCKGLGMYSLMTDILNCTDLTNKPLQKIKTALKNRPHTYRNLIQIMSIPKYSNKLSTMFKGLSTVDGLIERINSFDTVEECLAYRLKCNVTDSIISMVEEFNAHLEDIISLLTSVPVLDVGHEIDIIITGDVKPRKYDGRVYATKDDFIEFANILGSGVVTVSQTTLQIEVDYYVCDVKNSDTAKARKGRKFKLLKTSDELLNILIERRDELIEQNQK